MLSLPAPKAWFPVVAEIASLTVEDLQILPQTDWYQGLARVWQPGKQGALRRLEAFCAKHLHHYATLRDRPDVPATLHLSPNLHFGEISPRQVAASILAASDGNGAAFLRELFGESSPIICCIISLSCRKSCRTCALRLSLGGKMRLR
jgi:deoxyribodipyrimidine photo-lyase